MNRQRNSRTAGEEEQGRRAARRKPAGGAPRTGGLTPRRSPLAGRRSRQVAALCLLALLLAGCRRPVPDVSVNPPAEQAKTFADHWHLAVDDLRRFRAATAEPKPDAKQLAGLRDEIRQQFQSLRRLASQPAERTFIERAAPGLDAILEQLDKAVDAARQGEKGRAREAAREAGFILEETTELLRLAGP
jgi:hypothetical protein